MANFPDTMPFLPQKRPPLPVIGSPDEPAPPAQLITQGSQNPTATLAALMARQKMAAARQQGVMQQGAQNIPQGLGQLAWTFVNAMQENRAAEQEAQGRQQLAGLLGAIDPAAGPSSEQIGQVMNFDPDLAIELYKTRAAQQAAAAKQENWVDIPAPEGTKEGTQWQQNTVTGEKRAVGGAGISINTGQPLPAEVAGRIGLAQGFLDDFENVLKEVDAGNLTGWNYLPSVQFGRGTGGDAYRTIQSGVDALRRGLSGAGIGVQEASDYATRYAPQWSDDAATLRGKLETLRDDLLNVQDAVTQGRKIDLSALGKRQTTGPAAATPAPADAAPAATTPAPTETPAPADKGQPTEAYLKARPADIPLDAWIAEWKNADPKLW